MEKCTVRVSQLLQSEVNLNTSDFYEDELLYLLLSIRNCIYHGLKKRLLTGKKPSLWKLIVDYQYKWPNFIWESIETIQNLPPSSKEYNDAKLMSWILDGIMKNEIDRRLKGFISKKTMFYENYDPKSFVVHSSFIKMISILKSISTLEIVVDICSLDYYKYSDIDMKYIFGDHSQLENESKNLSDTYAYGSVTNESLFDSSTPYSRNSIEELEKLKGSNNDVLIRRNIFGLDNTFSLNSIDDCNKQETNSNNEFSLYIRTIQNDVLNLQKLNDEKEKLLNIARSQLMTLKMAIQNTCENFNKSQLLNIIENQNPLVTIISADTQIDIPYDGNINNNSNIVETLTKKEDNSSTNSINEIRSSLNIIKDENKKYKMELLEKHVLSLEILQYQSLIMRDNLSLKIYNRSIQNKLFENENLINALSSKLSKLLLSNHEYKELVIVNEKSTWIDDSYVKNCTQCNTQFSTTIRKHHCRKCGKIFCSKCSHNFIQLMKNTPKKRICDNCFYLVIESKFD